MRGLTCLRADHVRGRTSSVFSHLTCTCAPRIISMSAVDCRTAVHASLRGGMSERMEGVRPGFAAGAGVQRARTRGTGIPGRTATYVQPPPRPHRTRSRAPAPARARPAGHSARHRARSVPAKRAFYRYGRQLNNPHPSHAPAPPPAAPCPPRRIWRAMPVWNFTQPLVILISNFCGGVDSFDQNKKPDRIFVWCPTRILYL